MANMWRISDDEWDQWSAAEGKGLSAGREGPVRAAGGVGALRQAGQLAGRRHAGHRRAASASGLGRAALDVAPLRYDEQKTLMTLWSIARSPLIVGANLTLMDSKTLVLLGNPLVVALDQEGHAFEAKHEGALIAWRSSLPKGARRWRSSTPARRR
jgi:alpha-galactosidase